MSTLKVQEIQHTGGTTGLTIDSNGRVQLPQLVHFHGNRVGKTKEEKGGTVDYNVVRDTHSAWNTSNNQYTIPISGVYHFGFNNIGDSNTDTSDQQHKLQYVRGGTTVDFLYAYTSNDSRYEVTAFSTTYYLLASDLVQITNHEGVVYDGLYNTFSICLIG